MIDLEDAVDNLACPTIECSYRFEKVSIRQGMMGAPPICQCGNNSLWHQVQLISPFWIED